MFGSNRSAFGGGGFGNSTSNSTATFGSGTSAFGAPAVGGTGTGSVFGSTSTFGAPAATAPVNNGTGQPTYSAFQERDTNAANSAYLTYHSISAMPAYRDFSAEEYRVRDYELNKKFASSGFGGPSTGTSSMGFNSNTGVSAFGSSSSAFGAKPTFGTGTTGVFGNSSTFGSTTPAANTVFGGIGSGTGTSAFGSSSTSAFGAGTTTFGKPVGTGFTATTTGNTAFGGASTFGQPATGASTFGSGGFGQSSTSKTGFGANSTGFGGTNAFGAKPSGFTFGGTSTAATSGSAFGKPTIGTGTGFGIGTGFGQPSTGASAFGQNNATGGFGNTSGFGQKSTVFGATSQPGSTSTFGSGTFGSTTGAFSSSATANKPFGANSTGFATGGLGAKQSTGGFGFGANQAQQPQTGGFGQLSTGLGATQATNTFGSGGFGAKPAGTGMFGGGTGTGFGGLGQQQQQQAAPAFGLNQQAPFGQTNGFAAFGGQPNQQPGLVSFGTSSDVVGQQAPLFASVEDNALKNSKLWSDPTTEGTKSRTAPIFRTSNLANRLSSGQSLFGSVSAAETPISRRVASTHATVSVPPSTARKPIPATKFDWSFITSQKLKGFSRGSDSVSPSKTVTTVTSPTAKDGFDIVGSIPVRGVSTATTSLWADLGDKGKKAASPDNQVGTTPAKDSPKDLLKSGGRKSGQSSGMAKGQDSIPSLISATPTPAPRGSRGFTPKSGEQADVPSAMVMSGTPKDKGKGKRLVSFSPTPYGKLQDEDETEEEESVPRTFDESGKAPKLRVDDSSSDSEDEDSFKSNPLKLPGARAADVKSGSAQEHSPGSYWCKPSLEEIRSMKSGQRSQVHNFTIYRQGYGHLTFLQPVNLNEVADLDEMLKQGIVIDQTMVVIMEEALQRIPLQVQVQVGSKMLQEFRGQFGELDTTKLIETLKKWKGTRFESYDKETGVWSYTHEGGW